MADRGSIDIADLALAMAQAESVGVRLAVTWEADQWQLRRGEIIRDAPTGMPPRLWAYPQDAFIQAQVAGTVAGSLLGGRPQEVAGYKVVVPDPAAPNATFERIAGQRGTGALVTAWPRIEWQVSGQQTPTRQDGMLVGDGPSFLDYAAASSSFFDASPPDHQGGGRLWRVIRHDRRAWLHRIKIGPLTVVVDVRGTDLSGVRLDITSPTSSLTRPVGIKRRVTIKIPDGLGPRRHSHALGLGAAPRGIKMIVITNDNIARLTEPADFVDLLHHRYLRACATGQLGAPGPNE